MALDGGGSGGGPIGSANQFTGTGSGLELVGDHCYAYNNLNADMSSETTMLDCNTGNYYVVAQVNAAIGNASTDDFFVRCKINDTEIFVWYQHNSGTTEPDNWTEVVIPPYANFKLTLQNNTGSSARPMYTILTGRIYR